MDIDPVLLVVVTGVLTPVSKRRLQIYGVNTDERAHLREFGWFSRSVTKCALFEPTRTTEPVGLHSSLNNLIQPNLSLAVPPTATP